MKCEVGLRPALKELIVLDVYFCFNYTCQLSEPKFIYMYYSWNLL